MYGTPAEKTELEQIGKHFPDYRIINPSIFEGNPEKKRDKMEFCKRVVDTCHMVVFSRWKGYITAGVIIEVNHALDTGKLVFEIVDSTFKKVTKHIDGLSYEETVKMYDRDLIEKLDAKKRERSKAVLDYFNGLLRELESKKDGEELRFNKIFVGVKEISNQYYCEKQIELDNIHGKLENERMKAGTKAHEKLLEGAIPTSKEVMIQTIFSPRFTPVPKIELLGKQNGVILIGVPDFVLFYNGLALLVVDWKFPQVRKKLMAYPSELFQARLYCYLLHKMGFRTEKLRYAVVVVRGGHLDRKEEKAILDAIGKNRNERFIDVSLGDKVVRIQLEIFEKEKTELELNWALEYWQKKREAGHTDNPAICTKCEHNKRCEFSLAGQ
jgi:hypothetical protein